MSDDELKVCYIAGKGLLNGTKEDVIGILKLFGLEIKSENLAGDGREEDIICVKGPEDKMAAIKALTKSKMI